MKNYLINVFFYNEGGPSGVVSDSEKVDKKESKETNENVDVIKNLDKRTKKIFGIGEEASYYKINKTKNGINVEFNDGKKVLLNNKFLKLIDSNIKKGKYSNIDRLGINILDIVSNFEDKVNILKDTDEQLTFLSKCFNLSQFGENSLLKDRISSDKHYKYALTYSLLYGKNVNFMDEDDFFELVDVYEKKIFKKAKDKKDVYRGFIIDVSNNASLSFYQDKNFDALYGKLKINYSSGREEVASNIDLQILDDKLGLTHLNMDNVNIDEPVSISYGDLENYSTDMSFLYDKVVGKEKVSINELIMLNLALSSDKERLVKIFGNDYNLKLEKLAKKFGYSNYNTLRLEVYKKGVTVRDKNKMLLENKDMFYDLPLYQAKNLASYINNSINYNISEEERKNYREKAITILLELPSNIRGKILTRLVPVYEEKGLQPISEEILKDRYKQKVKSLFLIMNGLDGTENKEKIFNGFLSSLPNGVAIMDREGFKKSFEKFLSPQNISKLKEEFQSYGGNSMKFFIDKIFNGELGKYIKIPKKQESGNSKASIKMSIANMFLKVLEKNLKKQKIVKSFELVDKNQQFKGVINDSFNNVFGSNLDGTEKLKKDLLKMNLELVIFDFIPKNGLLTRKILEDNKQNILKIMSTKIGNSKGNIEHTYLSKVEKVLDNISDNIPSDGILFDKSEIVKIRGAEKFLKTIHKDRELYQKLGYEGYIRYYEKLEAEKSLLSKPLKTTVTIENSPFKDKTLDSTKVETVYEERGGIHTIYMHLPGTQNEVVKIEALKLADANKVAIDTYFNKMFNFPIRVEGQVDDINNLVSKNTNISKEIVTTNDFEDIALKTQNILYNNFYKNGTKKEKLFLSKNNLEDPYLMYNDPDEFGRKFVEGIKNQTEIGGIKVTDGYKIDLALIDKDLLDIDHAKKTKKEVLKNGKKENFGPVSFMNKLGKNVLESGDKIAKGFTSLFS